MAKWYYPHAFSGEEPETLLTWSGGGGVSYGTERAKEVLLRWKRINSIITIMHVLETYK